MKTNVGAQVDFEHSQNRDISNMLYKFVPSFIKHNSQLTDFPSKEEEEKSINMEVKVFEIVVHEQSKLSIIYIFIKSTKTPLTLCISRCLSMLLKTFIENTGNFN